MAIIADYPGLLASSHLSTLEMSPQKEFSYCASPIVLSRILKGRHSSHRSTPEASLKIGDPTQGGSSKRKADGDTAQPSSKRCGFYYAPWQSYRIVTFLTAPYFRKSVR